MNSEEYFAGIDIGSSAIKIVILNSDNDIRGHRVTPTGSLFNKNTLDTLKSLLSDIDISMEHLKYIVSTGYGRKLFRTAHENISEITANAKGATFFSSEGAQIKSIINIGGQDSKIIALDNNGLVKNFVMNDKCAAGTGRFLEMVSRNLGVDIDEMGKIHTAFNGTPSTVNSTCAVFAESEIITLLSNGESNAEVITGVHYSIAKRISRLARRIGNTGSCIF